MILKTILHFLRSPILLSMVFFSLTFLFFNPIYDEVDDVSMVRMASGHYGDVGPSSLLVYINPVYGQVLATLYAIWPSVGWYGVMFLAILFVALCLNLEVIFALTSEDRVMRLISILFIVPFYLHGIVSLEFTFVAGVAAGVGFLVLGHQMAIAGKYSRMQILMGAGLLFLASIIRENTIYYIFAISIPVIIFSFKHAINVKNKVVVMRCFLTILLLLLGAKLYSASLYSGSIGWKEYMKWSMAQAYFSEYDITAYEKNPEIYKGVGWSENDYKMLKYWFYTDERVFSTPKMAEVVRQSQTNNISIKGIQILIRTYLDQYQYHEVAFLSLAFFLAFISVLSPSKRKVLLYCLAVVAMGTGLIAYFSFLGRIVPTRFMYPLFMMLGMNVFVLVSHLNIRLVKTLLNPLILASVSFSLLLFGSLAYKSSWSEVKMDRFSEIITRIPKNVLVYNWGSSLPVHWISIFDTLGEFDERDIAGTGWPQRSPYDLAIFAKYNVSDIYVDMIDNPKVYLIATPEYVKLLETYLREHYHKEIKVEVVEDFKKYELFDRYGYGARLVKVRSN